MLLLGTETLLFVDLFYFYWFLETDFFWDFDLVDLSFESYLFTGGFFSFDWFLVFLATDFDCYRVFPLSVSILPSLKVVIIVRVALNCFWAYDFSLFYLWAIYLFFIIDCLDSFLTETDFLESYFFLYVFLDVLFLLALFKVSISFSRTDCFF